MKFRHSSVDDSVAPGIGRRRDGWANRDLNVGAILNLSPDLSAFATLLGVDEATVRSVLSGWGPGKFDAELILDGKAMRPDGKTAATLIPPAFGLAGVNLHTYTGWGSVPYWNAFVAVLEMHGVGTFFDPRLDDATRFPIAAKNGFGHVMVDADEDRVTSKARRPPGVSAEHQGSASAGGKLPTVAIARHRSKGSGRTRKAASSTTAASQPSSTSSTTTTRSSLSVSRTHRRTTWSSI